MPRISFLFRTDTHLAAHSPISWKGDYTAEIFSSLEQIGGLAAKYEVNAVLDGGDYFHVKASSKNPHHLVEKTIRIHRGYRCPTFGVEGNHDLAYNNLESLAKQPLGVIMLVMPSNCSESKSSRMETFGLEWLGYPTAQPALWLTS